MNWVRRRYGGLCSLACTLLLLAALAPSLSRMLHAATADLNPWSVVCSVPASNGDHEMIVSEHCPACLAPAAGWLPMPEQHAVLAPVALRDQLPRLFLQAPRLLYTWASAQPRAPPLPA